MKADNLYRHADGDFYCLLIADAPMKHPGNGDWIPGVSYTGVDGVVRSTSRERWDDRFTLATVADADDDPLVLSMVRRCNPGDFDFDLGRVMESWHESETSLSVEMVSLAVAATLEQAFFRPDHGDIVLERDGQMEVNSVSLLVKTEDLRRVLETYQINRTEEPHGFTFTLSRK